LFLSKGEASWHRDNEVETLVLPKTPPTTGATGFLHATLFISFSALKRPELTKNELRDRDANRGYQSGLQGIFRYLMLASINYKVEIRKVER